MSNLPAWPYASEVYSKAYRVLENMAKRGHAAKGGKRCSGHVSEEMRDLIDALNEGNEERIKGLLLYTHIYY